MTFNYGAAQDPLEGFIAQTEGRAPCVLVAHMWGGRVPFVDQVATHIAQLGYHGFAIDLYGQGRTGSGPDENREMMQALLGSPQRLRSRLMAAANAARDLAACDGRLAIVGYCMGGRAALEMARFPEARLEAAISVHGLLDADERPGFRGAARVLILHGDQDPMVPETAIAATQRELAASECAWQLITFGHTLHAFTNPAANDPRMGTVYDPEAAEFSWHYIAGFLERAFGRK